MSSVRRSCWHSLALALLLAMVEPVGVLMYSVQRRWRELAMRRALGATTSDALKLVFATAARVTFRCLHWGWYQPRS